MIAGVDPVDILLFLFVAMFLVIACLVIVMVLMYSHLKGIHNDTSFTRQDSGELKKINDRLFRINLDLNRPTRTHDDTVEIPQYIVRAGQQLYGLSAKWASESERSTDGLDVRATMPHEQR